MLSHSRYLIVSLHDLHPGSLEVVSKQINFCHKKGVTRFSILAIPHYHHGKKLVDDRNALHWLNQRAQIGDDIILHGYAHDRKGLKSGSLYYTRLYTANEAEFLALSDAELRHRLHLGMEIWEKHNWPLHGFIAPAWLLPKKQDRILKELGFTYTTRLKIIHNLKKNQFTETQSLCYSTRAKWRVAASLIWNRWLFNKLRKTKIIRLGLHPSDFYHPAIIQQIGDIIEIALAEGFKPVSYSEYVQM